MYSYVIPFSKINLTTFYLCLTYPYLCLMYIINYLFLMRKKNLYHFSTETKCQNSMMFFFSKFQITFCPYSWFFLEILLFYPVKKKNNIDIPRLRGSLKFNRKFRVEKRQKLLRPVFGEKLWKKFFRERETISLRHP